uniref:Zinc finger and BTB domain-containing protein 14 n=1 Tax=Labrus bergylta TaxID=56723 RepID=A0A3Q3FH11_9LABR
MSDLLRYIDYDHKATFLKMLNQQRMEGEHCDVVVVVENIEFRAHRCVLAACSNYFKKLFKKQTEEDNSIVELDFIRSDIFEEVLNYMYTARLAVRKKDINMMMSSGQILGINFLDNLCTQKRELTNMKTRENQAPGDHGMRAQDAILKELAMEEVRKNSFYDQGMESMGPGGSHVTQPHNYNTNMSKDPHSHGWGSSSSSDMKLEYLLYGHRDHGSCQSTGAKPLDHNAKKERLLTANRPYGCEHCPQSLHHSRPPQGAPEDPLGLQASQVCRVRQGLHQGPRPQEAREGPQQREALCVSTVRKGLQAQVPPERPRAAAPGRAAVQLRLLRQSVHQSVRSEAPLEHDAQRKPPQTDVPVPCCLPARPGGGHRPERLENGDRATLA